MVLEELIAWCGAHATTGRRAGASVGAVASSCLDPAIWSDRPLRAAGPRDRRHGRRALGDRGDLASAPWSGRAHDSEIVEALGIDRPGADVGVAPSTMRAASRRERLVPPRALVAWASMRCVPASVTPSRPGGSAASGAPRSAGAVGQHGGRDPSGARRLQEWSMSSMYLPLIAVVMFRARTVGRVSCEARELRRQPHHRLHVGDVRAGCVRRRRADGRIPAGAELHPIPRHRDPDPSYLYALAVDLAWRRRAAVVGQTACFSDRCRRSRDAASRAYRRTVVPPEPLIPLASRRPVALVALSIRNWRRHLIATVPMTIASARFSGRAAIKAQHHGRRGRPAQDRAARRRQGSRVRRRSNVDRNCTAQHDLVRRHLRAGLALAGGGAAPSTVGRMVKRHHTSTNPRALRRLRSLLALQGRRARHPAGLSVLPGERPPWPDPRHFPHVMSLHAIPATWS